MNWIVARWLAPGSALSRIFYGVAVVLALAGCGGPGLLARQDVQTASDEPEVRKRARIRMELALSYFEDNKATFALDEVKQVLITDPSYVEAYNLRGLIYMRLGNPQLAEDSFQRALALNSHDASVLQNYGWFECQRAHYTDAIRLFNQLLALPQANDRAKTYLTLGLCQAKAGLSTDAEASLTRSYELDAANPVTGYNLASILFKRGELTRAQFMIRRINNSELANAETLWLGVKVERRVGDYLAMTQLGEQLKKRFGASREATLLDRGAYDE